MDQELLLLQEIYNFLFWDKDSLKKKKKVFDKTD